MKLLRGWLASSGVLIILLTTLSVSGAAAISRGRIFSPGPLNAVQAPAGSEMHGSHADLACRDCHAPFWGAETMADRCLACHVDVQREMAASGSLQAVLLPSSSTQVNVHTNLPNAAQCRDCHSEHLGAQAAITRVDAPAFPHFIYGFSLTAHLLNRDGSPFTCEECHTQSLASFDVLTCTQCHTQLEGQAFAPHVAAFGETACMNCHDGVDSYGAAFDHSQTRFPLFDAHASLDCGACHQGAQTIEALKAAPTDCVGCHRSDDPHTDNMGDDCSACHNTNKWSETHFDHRTTGFNLTGAHNRLDCTQCHGSDVNAPVPTTCAGCHGAQDPHAGRLGQDCAACHTTLRWNDVVNFDHALTGFALTGKHIGVACTDCHTEGLTTQVSPSCVGCHTKDDAHHGQFGNDCGKCHNTSSWTNVDPNSFDHSLTGFGLTGAHTDLACTKCHTSGTYTGLSRSCTSCHTGDKPANHFSGECSQCHSTTAWKPAKFDHTGQTDCISCHTKDKPANHFSGQCSNCHSTTAWTPAKPDHTGLTDCSSCHTKDKPAKHYTGQCSTCHTTSAWRPASFNHSGQSTDCASCHTKDKPANHYAGQCSLCHATNAWQPANFNHSGQTTDCASCHTKDKPSNHYTGQCSLCHATSAWQPANFNHSGQTTDCASCHTNDKPSNHYAGQCSLCHTTSAWQPANFNHTGQTDCASCHTNDKPANHFSGQCSQCHSTSAWTPATFNHPSSPLALTGQHAVPPRACTDCHTSSDYSKVATTCDGCHHSTYTGANDPNHTAKGMSDFAASNCSNCHSPTASNWSNASWSHMRIVNPQRVSLPHERATCANCHQVSSDYTVKSCAGSGCHRSATGPD